jgi:hypothetical protein
MNMKMSSISAEKRMIQSYGSGAAIFFFLELENKFYIAII